MSDIISFPVSRCASARVVVPAADRLNPSPTVSIDPELVQVISSISETTVDDYEPNRQTTASDDDVVLRAIAECDAGRKSGGEPLSDTAWIIRTSMRWIKRRSRKLSSLPRLHRGLLDQHCTAGDPTALMFRDWIEGKHLHRLVPRSGGVQSIEPSPSGSAVEGGF